MSNQDLTQKQKIDFPRGFKIGPPESQDFWDIASDSPKESVSSLCNDSASLLGTEQNNDNCVEFAADGTTLDCYRLGVKKFNYAQSIGVHTMYDASRGGIINDNGVSKFPYSAAKCFNVAQAYYSGFQNSPVEPILGLSYSYAQGEDQEAQGTYEQISIGYGDLKKNHPYGSNSPYGKEKLNTNHPMFGDSSEFAHRIFAKNIETTANNGSPGVDFNSLSYAFFTSMSLADNQTTVIEVTDGELILHLDQCSSTSKHHVKFNTCKTCVRSLPYGAFNTVATGDSVDHTRPSGTLEEMAMDRQAPEGGCKECSDKLLSSYLARNSSSQAVSSNLIGLYQ